MSADWQFSPVCGPADATQTKYAADGVDQYQASLRLANIYAEWKEAPRKKSSIEEIVDLLRRAELGQYVDTFVRDGTDWSSFLDLTRGELLDRGVPFGKDMETFMSVVKMCKTPWRKKLALDIDNPVSPNPSTAAATHVCRSPRGKRVRCKSTKW